MKLIYNDTKKEVKIGDRVLLECQEVRIVKIEIPLVPASNGRICVDEGVETICYWPSMFNATWVEREDR